MEYTLGNWSGKKKVILDGRTVKVQKKNGELIKSWNLDEIEGVAYKAPNGLTNGVLVFCETYHESLETSLFKLGTIPHGVVVAMGDRDSAKEILEWFNTEKGNKS